MDEPQSELTPIDKIMIDVNRAFVLHCCTMTKFHLTKNNADKMVEFAKMAVVDTVLLIEAQDNHAKQVEINLTYIFSSVQKLFPQNIAD